MVWVTALKKKIHRSDFRHLRWHLLICYLAVMATILGVFAIGVYVFVTRSGYQQIDAKLRTLAQAAAPSLNEIENQGSSYLEQVDEVPWRDLFNRDRQSLEWFNAEGLSLASKGQLELDLIPQIGPQTVRLAGQSAPIRTYTVSIYTDSSDRDKPSLEGYIRASQSTEALATSQRQLFWGLGMGGIMALGLSGLGGLWLTQKALAPIEQSFQQLRRFTADASHELRSPLTAVKTSVDVMLSHPERVHPKDVKKLAAISSATEQMSQLVGDLLFLARTDADAHLSTIPRELKPVSLNQTLQDVLELLEPSAHAKEITLTSELPFTLFVFGDPTQLSRLFFNLLENAIKYTPAGGTVLLSLTKQNRFAVVRVKDTGTGISEDQLPLIFDRFWRADKARSRREGGTGLGLSIVQAIAIRHKGRVTVTSGVDSGTCFQVRLPRVASTLTLP